jgi:hypothetical protein
VHEPPDSGTRAPVAQPPPTYGTAFANVLSFVVKDGGHVQLELTGSVILSNTQIRSVTRTLGCCVDGSTPSGPTYTCVHPSTSSGGGASGVLAA